LGFFKFIVFSLKKKSFKAIILDREYLDSKYENVLEEMKTIVEKVLREDLKNGGLIVSYYSWTKINLKKGKFCH
jgi:hypothetical protein